MHFFDILNTAFKIEKRGSAPRFPPPPRDAFKIRGPLFLRSAPQCVQNFNAPLARRKSPARGLAPIAPGAYFPALAALAALALARRARSAALCSSLSGRRAGFGWTFTNPFGTMKCPTWGCPPQIS